jgi:AraC-like DNA-binding protein
VISVGVKYGPTLRLRGLRFLEQTGHRLDARRPARPPAAGRRCHTVPMAGPAKAETPSGRSYAERRPVPALAGLVWSAWIQRVCADAAPYLHRNVPDGSVELSCAIGSVPRIIGPLTSPRVQVIRPGSTVAGVRFYPGAAARVLGVPLSELTDQVVDVPAVWGRSARPASDRVTGCASGEDALVLMQQLIAGRLADAGEPDPLIAEAVRRLMPWRPGGIGSLRSALSISERQFRRRCQVAIGVAPKELQRMLRFQGVLARAQFALSRGRKPAGEGLARLAADAGYADQPHLTRECLRLTGLTPRAFLRQTEQTCGSGHDHEASFAPLLRPGAPAHAAPA